MCIFFQKCPVAAATFFFTNTLVYVNLQFTKKLIPMKTYTFTLNLIFSFLFLAMTSQAVAQDGCDYYFRSIDGACNNFDHQEWGKADIPMFREIVSHYGQPDFRNSFAGQGRMNPRAISNLVCAQDQDGYSKLNLSSYVYSWGQFIDHDITATPGDDTEPAPIPVPYDDPVLSVPIKFNRSAAREGTGEYDPRQQSNSITAWIDGSGVYGSDQERADWLRTFEGGKLKMSKGGLLPYNTIDGEKDSPVDPNAPDMANEHRLPKVFVAGDHRANEQPGLTSLHTLFVREHNRLCDEFIRLGYHSDEDNYQTARALIAAYIQTITYNEYLPALGIKLAPYSGYNPHVRPDVMNIFATAAFRYGHSNVESEIFLAEDDYFVSEAISLERAFFTTRIVEENNIKPVLLGLVTQKQRETDLFVIDNLRNFLFSPAPNSPGLDLAALNIQRGRDHGLPDYNTVRTHFLGKPATSWDDITTDYETQEKLKAAYGNNLNDIDLWIGLMAEDHIYGGEVGPTMAAVIKEQFERMRDGDRFFYEIDPVVIAWGEDLTRDIKLSTILWRNLDAYYVPYDVFHVFDGQAIAEKAPNHEVARNTVENSKKLLSVTASPNPTKGLANISLRNENETTLDLNVVSLDGQVIRRIENRNISSFHQEQLDLSDLPGGVYALQMKVGEQRIYKRIILNK